MHRPHLPQLGPLLHGSCTVAPAAAAAAGVTAQRVTRAVAAAQEPPAGGGERGDVRVSDGGAQHRRPLAQLQHVRAVHLRDQR